MRWEEFAAGARFRTVRLTLRHWADRDIYRRTLERFRHNPTITEWLGGSAGQWSGTEESGWRVWIERPFSYRVESMTGGLPRSRGPSMSRPSLPMAPSAPFPARAASR